MQFRNKVTWVVELLDDRVRGEPEALPDDMRARFRRIVELIQGYGLARVHEPHIKHLLGDLWEMRMKGRDGISRAIYVTAKWREYAALEGEFLLTKALIEARARGVNPGASCQKDADYASRYCTPGKRWKPALHAHTRALCQATGSRLRIAFEPA